MNQKHPPFKYQHLGLSIHFHSFYKFYIFNFVGSMASVGDWKGVYDSTNSGLLPSYFICSLLYGYNEIMC